MTDVVIAGAARTAVGSFNGSLSSLPASQLGAVAIREAMQRAKVAAAEVDEAIMGQILIAGAGQHPARQAAVEESLPYDQTDRKRDGKGKSVSGRVDLGARRSSKETEKIRRRIILTLDTS